MDNKKNDNLKMFGRIVGLFEKSKTFGFVKPDDKKIFKKDIFIPKAFIGKARNGQKVVVEIVKESVDGKKAEGKIVEILGFPDEAGIDMLSIIKQFDLPSEFLKDVILEAKNVSKEPISLKHRRDLRDEEIFTIDGEDAKDLDDAVCVKRISDELYELGVHIADVSHYVRENTEINKEAINRSTSVYMLDRVIPMLPVELSNGACSLNQHEDRYAMSCVMKINKKGEVINADVFKSVINVTKRMNYHEVQVDIDRNNYDIINNYDEEKKKYAQDNISADKDYLNHLDLMAELATILKNRRIEKGYLELDIPESKIILDKKGKPIDVRPYDTSFSNEIVEQFMLTANETIAEKFYWLDAPFIYRVHEKPDEEKVKDFNKFLIDLGYHIKGKLGDVKSKSFAQILEQVKGKDEERVVSTLLLRTLKMARYDAENLGHFGIAGKYYCHFTSPIRRYPDLFIHRIISKYIEANYDVNDWFKTKYYCRAEKYALRSSMCEQRATKAEREADDMKMAEYMEGKIGVEYDGIISSVTKFGVFIELPNTIEGLARYEKMEDDYYIFDENRKVAIGEQTSRTYKIGDKVKVVVIDANKELRRIDFKIL